MNSDFFTGNRKRLIDELKGGIIVLAAHTKMHGSGDSAAEFTQEANFWWLCGIESPDWQLIFDGFSGDSWLVSPAVSDSHQLFDGSLPPDRAKRISGVNSVLDANEATDKLRALAKRHRLVYTLGDPSYARHADFILNPAPKKMWRLLERTFASVQDCRKDLARLRAIKQPTELNLMQKAADLTMDAFKNAKDSLASARFEYEVEAEVTYAFRRGGARHAFHPIVASGKNACTLHYDQNAASTGKDRMLLIDAGAHYHGYAADVTRTYGAGEISPRQAAVHDAVKEALGRIINVLKPDVTLTSYIQSVDMIMKEYLLTLGLIKNMDDDDAYRHYFPHAISHGLGVDVHESLGGWTYLQPGMVLTVEPGIYIPKEGIGVRIEDNVVITKNGHRNLTGRLSTDI